MTSEYKSENKFVRACLIDSFVDCVPFTTTKQQPRVVSLPNGRKMAFQPAKVKKAEKSYLSMFLDHAPETPLDGPLSVLVEFHFPFRKSEKKRDINRGWSFVETRPDVENIAKLFIDAIAPKYFVDDARICEMAISKFRSNRPGVRLMVHRLLYTDGE